MRGIASKKHQNYYYFDISDIESDYEISLVPTNGGRTDFLLSLDINNKYPTIENNVYSSKNEFTTYNVLFN